VVEDEPPLETDCEFIAENRSCINFPNACRTFRMESVDEVELSDAEFALQFGTWPFGGEGIGIPIWLNVSMMLCINVSFPPEFD
jgi:hypothetical protein